MQGLRFAGWWRGFRAFPSRVVIHSPEERLQKATEARCKFRLPCLSAFLPRFSNGFSGGKKKVWDILKYKAHILKSKAHIFSLLPRGVYALKISFQFSAPENAVFRHLFCCRVCLFSASGERAEKITDCTATGALPAADWMPLQAERKKLIKNNVRNLIFQWHFFISLACEPVRRCMMLRLWHGVTGVYWNFIFAIQTSQLWNASMKVRFAMVSAPVD